MIQIQLNEVISLLQLIYLIIYQKNYGFINVLT